MAHPARIPVGAIVCAHGIKGQVKIRFSVANTDALLKHNAFTDAAGRVFKLTKSGISKDLMIASIDGICDRNEAEKLKNTQLFAPALKSNKKTNEWSYAELIGLEARLDNGKKYGKVIGVHNFGAGDIIEIELSDGKTEMLPFSGVFVGRLDVKSGYMVVMPPEYVEGEKP